MTLVSVQAWQRVHTWTSVVSTAFLLLSCITGLPLIFHDDLDAWLAPPVAQRAGPPPTPALSIDELAEHARARFPREFVQFVFWDEREPGVLGVGMASTADAPLEAVHRLMLDRWTGDVAEDRPPESGVLETLLDLHRSLLSGPIGELLLGLVALCVIAAIGSGIALYGPFARRIRFGEIRTRRSRRLAWLDLHNLIGMTTAAWLLIVGATGFVNTLESPLFAAWQSQHLDRLLTPFEGQPYPAVLSSPQAAVDTAVRALPGMRPTSEGFPYSRFGSPRHYLIWMHGSTPLTAHLFTPVLVDAATGALASAAGMPWYVRVLEVSRPLHFGDYGGWPLKLLWALLDLLTISVLVTGLGLWWWRRRQRPVAIAHGDTIDFHA